MPRLALWIVACWLTAAMAAGWYTARFVRISTDTADMLAAELPFRQAYQRFREAFPDQVDAFVVVVEATTPEHANAAAIELARRLQLHTERFTHVEVPAADPYLARNALLYMDEPDLASLADWLVAAAPFIGLLNRESDLFGFAKILTGILRDPSWKADANADVLLGELARATAAEARREPYATSWQSLLSGAKARPAHELILVKPVLDWSDVLAAEAPLQAIRTIAHELRSSGHPDVTVRVTGDAALAHEEINSALGSSPLSVLSAIIVITVILAWGLHSAWMTFGALLTLLTGLSLTAAFATWAVGELNLLSFAAAILYLGLGVDYAIHFGLRYREALARGLSRDMALRHTTSAVRGALLLCATMTACGFFSFLPTDFAGIAQLGLICGTGMFINLVVTLSLLPALLGMLPAPAPWPTSARSHAWIEAWIRRRQTAILVAGALLALGALLLIPRIAFDRDPLNLRDPRSESVAALRALQGDPHQPLASITVLASDAAAAAREARALRELTTVGNVTTAADLAPQASATKLALIDELAILLEPALTIGATPEAAHSVTRTVSMLDELRGALREVVNGAGDRDQSTARTALAGIDALLNQPDGQLQKSLASLEMRLLSTLPATLDRLRAALHPDPVPVPESLLRRWVASDGTQRIAVYPREPLDNASALRQFVESVQSVAPEATDEPVLNLRAGDAIVGAFREAMTISVVLIAVTLVTLLGDLRRAALVMTPLIMAGLLTMATLGLAGVPFNFANVIALPLLLGANVDNGIHMVHRYYDTDGRDLAGTSTSRAILFSGLANMCGFANLLTSSHPGTASIGLVLTVGMAWTLLTTMIAIPALLIGRPVRARHA